jgi:hypothetical protein
MIDRRSSDLLRLIRSESACILSPKYSCVYELSRSLRLLRHSELHAASDFHKSSFIENLRRPAINVPNLNRVSRLRFGFVHSTRPLVSIVVRGNGQEKTRIRRRSSNNIARNDVRVRIYPETSRHGPMAAEVWGGAKKRWID